jgi:hypothetical protein
VALFSINKWPYFRLSRFMQDAQSGLVFGQQMALFSIDKNIKGPGVKHRPKAAQSGYTERWNPPKALSAMGVGDQPDAQAGSMPQEAKAPL